MKKYVEKAKVKYIKYQRLAELSLMGYHVEKDEQMPELVHNVKEYIDIDTDLLSSVAIEKLKKAKLINMGMNDNMKILTPEMEKEIDKKLSEFENTSPYGYIDFINNNRDVYYKYDNDEDYIVDDYMTRISTISMNSDPEKQEIINILNGEEEKNNLLHNSNIKHTRIWSDKKNER